MSVATVLKLSKLNMLGMVTAMMKNGDAPEEH